MRLLASLLLLWGAQFVLAEDPAPKSADKEPHTVNKPVISQSPAVQAVEKPLHEHPLLQKMLSRNNVLRQLVGLKPHRVNPALTKAAQDHANYMAETHDFNHYSNGGPSGRAAKWGFDGGVTENIAMGGADVDSAFAMWQASRPHWANLTGGTTEAGFGLQKSADGRAYFVAVYGNSNQEHHDDSADTVAKGEESKPLKAPADSRPTLAK